MPSGVPKRAFFPRAQPAPARPVHPLLARVGSTPLVELHRLTRGAGRRVFVKLEGENPGGSVKDRAARAIIERAFLEGRLPAKRLLDASSGNTGIAYAMFGAALGFGVTICLPESASPERRKILRAHGAEVVETDPLEGSDGAIRKARELATERPDAYYYADQYSNPSNPSAHERTTGPEILRQLEGLSLDLFAAGLGTSGTFVGTARFLRRRSPATRLLAVQPDASFHGIEGLKHMASAIVPRIWEPSLADVHAGVSTEEAQEMTRRLAREEGILAGVSSGAALAAALLVGRELGARTIAVIFPDRGDRYLSERFWSQE
ncbi:MAG: PLP-dependent cysteine synthase family protein [Acidithiobacillales bacterium]